MCVRAHTHTHAGLGKEDEDGEGEGGAGGGADGGVEAGRDREEARGVVAVDELVTVTTILIIFF